MTHSDDNLTATVRELISQRIGQLESQEEWLARLRRENAEEAACVPALESLVDQDARHRLDSYYGCDDYEREE